MRLHRGAPSGLRASGLPLRRAFRAFEVGWPLAVLALTFFYVHLLIHADGWVLALVSCVAIAAWSAQFIWMAPAAITRGRRWGRWGCVLEPVPFPVADPDGRGALAKLLRTVDAQVDWLIAEDARLAEDED